MDLGESVNNNSNLDSRVDAITDMLCEAKRTASAYQTQLRNKQDVPVFSLVIMRLYRLL